MIVAAVALTLVATVRSSGSTMKVGRTFSSPIVSVVGVVVIAAPGSTLRSRTGGSLLQILKLRGKIHVECWQGARFSLGPKCEHRFLLRRQEETGALC